MEILFCGVRGTTPRAEPEFAGYGGHTTCVLVTGAGGERLLLDAGSGVHLANAALGGAREPLVLFTHLHLDHVLGLPMLACLFDPEATPTLAGLGPDGPRAALARLLAPPVWPLGLDDVPARVAYRGIDAAGLGPDRVALRHGGLEIRGVAMPHPNGCTAWRVDEPATGAAFVQATDVEWGKAGETARAGFLELCRGADLLAMDGHFTADEIAERAGWGHSSTAECIEVARAAGVGALRIVHHAPDNDDVRLAEIEADARALWSGAALARQGETFHPDRDRKDAT